MLLLQYDIIIPNLSIDVNRYNKQTIGVNIVAFANRLFAQIVILYNHSKGTIENSSDTGNKADVVPKGSQERL